MMTYSIWAIRLFVAAITTQLMVGGIPACAQGLNDPRKAVRETSDEQLRTEFQRRYDQQSGVAQPPSEKSGTRDIGSPVSNLDDGQLIQAAREEGRSRVIYGTDDRKDWYEIKNPAVAALARASVALFRSADIAIGSDNITLLKTQPLRAAQRLCADEKFVSQPSGAFCSGTLVRPDVILTAGHCVREISGQGSTPAITSVRFVFGYQMRSASLYASISDAQVFAGKEILGGTMNPKADDWALIRLARPVPATIAEPVSVWETTPVSMNQKVFVIGFPSGIPLKYAPGAEIRDIANPGFFVANLDTFGGNSGAGVYDEATNRLIGVLVRGDTDYKIDARNNCYRANLCPTSGCRGEDVTRITVVPKP